MVFAHARHPVGGCPPCEIGPARFSALSRAAPPGVGGADPAALDALCLDRIARFKRPKDYVFVDALPKNNYGKILKTELRVIDARRGA